MENDYEWDYIEQEVWKPTDDQNTIIGTLIGKEPKDENIGARYYIENKSGKFIVWGSAVLDNKMQFVDVGQAVKITYQGKSKGRQGQDLNNFAVAIGKAVHPAVGTPATEKVEIID
jgi:hypothetical protein